jgi:hypothetical protein
MTARGPDDRILPDLRVVGQGLNVLDHLFLVLTMLEERASCRPEHRRTFAVGELRQRAQMQGGHSPGHVRDTFLSAIAAYDHWELKGSEPTVEFEVHYEPRPIPISKACGLVWNCTDILPGYAIDILVGNGVEPKSRTYAAAARALLSRLKP